MRIRSSHHQLYDLDMRGPRRTASRESGHAFIVPRRLTLIIRGNSSPAQRPR